MVDPDEVRRVAGLARLELGAEEETALVGHLISILEHFEVLQDVDTEGVAPMSHPLDAQGVPAADEVVAHPRPRESIVDLTEHAREGFYIVPRVLETTEHETGVPPAEADEAEA